MTRPGIVRADTIDLQPQTSPSAQDHSRKSHTTTHQAAELRHVQDERHSEEEILSNAWHSANGLSDEPPSDDEEIINMRDDQPAQQNGGQTESTDADGDSDMDDDMMDKISSSPSISDGGYFQFTTSTPIATTPRLWPSRSSSLYTPTPPRSSANQHHNALYVDDSDGSSPSVSKNPARLSVSTSAPRTASPFPFRSALSRMRIQPSTPLSISEEVELESEQSSSPFVDSPAHFPLNYHNSSRKVKSASHHHCEIRTIEAGYEEHWRSEDWERSRILIARAIPPKDKPQSPRNMPTFYQQPRFVKSASDIEFEAQLLPVDDPLLEDVFIDSKDNAAASVMACEDEDEGWETESDTKYSDDSFESDAYDSDDDKTWDCKLPADDDRFIDSGWGGECLRETEDIDFEFVYALHTFVATVEGQANAQKGDTMVLLDDSNSYWWLVRVVKDSTIGYLPAEHIETPTERLARLNKHRNVDLSQTMLGDNTEKTKNPLKKAMRRRNAKTVQFAPPTYIEPSEYEYTTDEESDDDVSLTNGSAGGQVEATKEQSTSDPEKDEISTVAPLKVKDKKRDMSPEKAATDDEDGDRRRKIDESRASDEQFDRDFSVNSQKQSRNGTPRNTDSFFRDESIETRKITLTPNILRDDSNGAVVAGKTSLDRGPSLELLEKDPKPTKGSKKEKKPGMLSGLFKRKEKKGKTGDDASSTRGKLSGETLRESPTFSSEEASPIERPGTADGVQRSGSKGKLQKSPPTGGSPTGNLSPAPTTAQKKPSAESISATSSGESTPRSSSPATTEKTLEKSSSLRARASESISSKLRNTTSSPEESKPTKVKRAKTREALDVESSPDEESKDPFADSEMVNQAESRLAAPPGPSKLGAMSSTERLSESPVHITSADAMPDNEPPALVGDTSSSSSDELTSLRSSPSPPMTSAAGQLSPQASLDSMTSPSAPAPLSIHKQSTSTPPPPTREPPAQPNANRGLSPARNNSTSTTNSTLSPSMSSNSPSWSDAHLRAYMDTTEDIKDLLVVVHDTNGVVPVSMDHPLMSSLFVEERGKVKELDSALDNMLSQWLARKRGVLGRKGSTPTPGSRLAAPQQPGSS